MVIMFAGDLRQALLRVFDHRTLQLLRLCLVLFHQRGNLFSSLIDVCLRFKNKEKPKTGPRLNYDVKLARSPALDA